MRNGMKGKRILSFVILLALVMSLTDGMSVSRMREVSAAGRKAPAVIEKVLVPEEKYWQYEENEYEEGTVCITGFDDRAAYTWEDWEKEYEYIWEGKNEVGRGTTYKLVVPGIIAGKKVTCVGGDSSDFYNSYRVITSIQIPEGVKSIREIGEYSLVSAELPSTLETIGKYAFWSGNDSSSSLTNVTIPNGVREIEDSAFMECDKLSSIRLPAGLETIGEEAFYGCWSLQNMVIPASVSGIDETAFADCRGMKAFEVELNNKGDYFSEDGILCKKWIDEVPVYGNQVDENGEPIVEYYKDVEMKILVSYPGSKKGVYNLTADMNFSWTAFLNCKGLTAVNVDSENTYYSSVDGVVYEKDMKTLCVCPAGKTGEYTVPEGVRSLAMNSFSNSALHTIHLPDSLGEKYTTDWGNEEAGFIGSYSFYQCDALQTITIGKGTTEDILSHLRSTSNLKNISISDQNPTLCTVDNVVYDKGRKKILFVPVGKKGSLVLPDTVETSESNICGTGITKLVLGRDYRVEEKTYVVDDDDGEKETRLIGLPSLDALQAFEVSPANNKLASYDGVLYTKDLKMLYCCPPRKKGTVTIPNGTTTIWPEAFEDCDDIVELSIPASVTDIRLAVNHFSDITIKGYIGSAAEAYVKSANAEGRNIKFIALGTVVSSKTNLKITLKKVKALGKRKVKVTWKRLAGAGGYQLQYAMNRSFKKKVKKKNIRQTATNVTLKKLKKGATYYFRIRAYNNLNSSKKYGKWSNVKKIKVK